MGNLERYYLYPPWSFLLCLSIVAAWTAGSTSSGLTVSPSCRNCNVEERGSSLLSLTLSRETTAWKDKSQVFLMQSLKDPKFGYLESDSRAGSSRFESWTGNM